MIYLPNLCKSYKNQNALMEFKITPHCCTLTLTITLTLTFDLSSFNPKPCHFQDIPFPIPCLNTLGSFVSKLCCEQTNRQTDRRTQKSYPVGVGNYRYLRRYTALHWRFVSVAVNNGQTNKQTESLRITISHYNASGDPIIHCEGLHRKNYCWL